MQKFYSHLNEYKWSCNLSTKDNKDEAITSNIQYTPSKGIRFEILTSDLEAISTLENIDRFYGRSIEFGNFTLIKCVHLNSTANNSITKLKFYARMVIFGDLFNNDASFFCSKIGLLSLDKFCEPFADRSTQNNNKFVFLEGEGDEDKWSVEKRIYSGSYVYKENLLDEFHFKSNTNNQFEQTLNEKLLSLNDFISQSLSEYENIRVTKKNPAIYEFNLDFFTKCNFDNLISKVFEVNNFFSILLLRSSFITHVNVYESNSGNSNSFAVLVSAHFDEDKIDKIQKNEKSYFKISSNQLNNCFEISLKGWKDLTRSLDLTLNAIREHIQGSYNIVQHSVICITALEQWYNKYEADKGKTKLKKYDFMVDKYATNAMKIKLENNIPFNVNKEDDPYFGKAIAYMRNAVLHPKVDEKKNFKDGRSEKTLVESDYYNFTEIIIMILIRALYTKFGVNSDYLDANFGKEGSEVLCVHSQI